MGDRCPKSAPKQEKCNRLNNSPQSAGEVKIWGFLSLSMEKPGRAHRLVLPHCRNNSRSRVGASEFPKRPPRQPRHSSWDSTVRDSTPPFRSRLRTVSRKKRRRHVKTIVLNSNLTESTQEANVRTLIADHVNGIVIDVIESVPTAAMVKLANAAHIPIMLVHGYAGSKYPPPVYKGVAYDIDENEVTAGKEAGQLALKAVPNGGDVAIIEGTAGYQAVAQRADGFLSVINPTNKYTVVATQPGGWTDTIADTACSAILQAHPTVALFYAESDDMAEGCVTAIKRRALPPRSSELAARRSSRA